MTQKREPAGWKAINNSSCLSYCREPALLLPERALSLQEAALPGQGGNHPQGNPSPLRRLGSFLKACFRGLSYAVTVLLVALMALLVFALVQGAVTNQTPSVLGYQLYIVQGDSMGPTMEVGSLALVRPVEAEEIARGDVITYRSAGGESATAFTTHRVVDIHPGSPITFTTQGDANQAPDAEPVTPDMLQGRMETFIPYGGYALDFVTTERGLLLLVILPALLVLVMEIRNLFKYVAEEERKEKEAQEGENAPAGAHSPLETGRSPLRADEAWTGADINIFPPSMVEKGGIDGGTGYPSLSEEDY